MSDAVRRSILNSPITARDLRNQTSLYSHGNASVDAKIRTKTEMSCLKKVFERTAVDQRYFNRTVTDFGKRITKLTDL